MVLCYTQDFKTTLFTIHKTIVLLKNLSIPEDYSPRNETAALSVPLTCVRRTLFRRVPCVPEDQTRLIAPDL